MQEQLKKMYWPLLVAIGILGIISISTIKLGYLYINLSNAASLWEKQVIYFGIGLLIIWAINKFTSDRIYSSIWVSYGILMAFLVGLVIYRHLNIPIPFVKTINGATSWYNFPGFSFQPSEFMKIVLLVLMAKMATDHNEKYKEHTFSNDIKLIITVLKPSLPVCLMVYLQNDAGVTLIILTSIILVLFGAGLRGYWFLTGFIIVAIVLGLVAYIFIFHNDIFTKIFGDGHSVSRIYGWLDPEGTYADQGYQLYNSLMAYGTAGTFGHGFSSVIISLQEAQTDFIFALIAVGFGFSGALITLIAIASLDILIVRVALRTSSMQDKCFIFGLIGILLFQQTWNISMVLGLLPITGITLPLLSYGGSSLISYMIAFGIVMEIEKQTLIEQGKNRY